MGSKELVALADSLRGKYVTLEVVGGRAGEAVYLHGHRVNVDDANRVDTGLVTATGEAIYRVQPPVGFGRDDEW